MTSLDRIKVAMTLSTAKAALNDLRGAGWQLTRRNFFNNVRQFGGEVFPEQKIINIARNRVRSPMASFFHEMGHWDDLHSPNPTPRGANVSQALQSELTANQYAAQRVKYDPRYLDYARTQYRKGYITPLNAGAVADMKPEFFQRIAPTLERWEVGNQMHPWDVAPVVKSITRNAVKNDPNLADLMRRHYSYSAPYSSRPGI